MDELLNSKNRMRRDSTYEKHYLVQVRKRKFLIKNKLALALATLKTKENDTLRGDLYILQLRNKKSKKRVPGCRKKFKPFSNLNTNRATIIIKRGFVVNDALILNPSEKQFDKEMFVDKNKNEVDQIFECIKIKSESVTDDLKMKIKKCQKKTKRKEGLSDKSDTVHDNNKVPKHANTFSNNKNRVQQVVNKILKRKRQTCRKQFRHKDITFYKLGIDNNNKGSPPKKEVIQKIFQKRPSHTSLPSMRLSENNCASNVQKPGVNEIVNNSENGCSSPTNVGCLESKQESLSRIHINGAECNKKKDENTKTCEGNHIKRGLLNYSIASLTSEITGKHNLPIRIPEKRSSIAEPLHAFSPYVRFQTDQSPSTTSFNLTNNSYQAPTTNVSDNRIGSSPVNTDKQFDVTKITNQNIHKMDSAHVEKPFVSTPTITHGSTIPSKDGIQLSNNNNTFNNSIKPLKRKSLNSEYPEPNKVKVPATCVKNSSASVSDVNTTHTYPQHNIYSEALSRPRFPPPIVPIYAPYREQPSLLPPFVFNYDYINRLHFNPIHYDSIIDKKIENPMYLTKDTPVINSQVLTYQPEPQIKKLPSPKLLINAQETETVLKNEVPTNLPKDAPKCATPKKEPAEQSNTTTTLSERNDVPPVPNGEILTRPVKIASPVVISDSDNETAEVKPVALNLTKSRRSSNSKNSLMLITPKKENSLSSSAQTRVMKTLSTLTYVVNEIIDKAGDNMPKQDKELLHKLLENVCETSTTEKKCDVVIKQEPNDVVELISSDSESSNDSNPALLTDSNGTLDLSMKTYCSTIKPPSTESTKANETVVDSTRIRKENSSEQSVLNLTKKSTFCQNDNDVINLSMRDRKDQLVIFKENGNVFLPPVTTLANNTSNTKPINVDSKKPTQTAALAEKQHPNASIQNNVLKSPDSNTLINKNQPYVWPSHFTPSSCSVINKSVEVGSGQNSTNQNNWVSDQSNVLALNKDNSGVKPHYDKSQCTAWNQRNPVDYFNSHFYTDAHSKPFWEKSVPPPNPKPNDINSMKASYPSLTNPKQNDVKSINATYPPLTNSQPNDVNSMNATYPLLTNPKQNHVNSINTTYPPPTYSKPNNVNSINVTYAPLTKYPALSTLNTINQIDSSVNDKNVLHQHKTYAYAKQKVDKSIKELLQKKHKNRGYGKTSHLSYGGAENPSTTATHTLTPTTSTETFQFSRPTTNQNNFHYNNPVDVFSESSRPPRSFLQYRDTKFNSAWDNNQKFVGESSYSSNSKNQGSEPQALNQNLSPDYGYFSPLSKFAANTENTQHTNNLFSKSLDSLNSSDNSSKGIQDKSQPCSPILHQHDQEKLMNILPKLHSSNTLTPEQYVMEVHVLEIDGCPKPFLDFYSYITKKQIASNQRPVCFRIFLEFQNAGKLKEFERAFRIYSQKHENERHVIT